ncbi:hypothetical protein [Agromyces humatus]|nr:hypothetical protein [Agromyces humatus]
MAVTSCSGTGAGDSARVAPPPSSDSTAGANRSGDLAGTVDLPDGRSMYVECRASGSPTVVLVAGLDAAGDLWDSTHPEQVAGLVLVDSLSPELRADMTPQQWEIWNVANARSTEQIADYPDLERIDADRAHRHGHRRRAREPVDRDRLA